MRVLQRLAEAHSGWTMFEKRLGVTAIDNAVAGSTQWNSATEASGVC
jgi:hypothetical protein